MIDKSSNTIIKYYDLTNIQIVPGPNIYFSQGTYELFTTPTLEFLVNYIYDFPTAKVQYRENVYNSEFQDVISLSPLNANERKFTAKVNLNNIGLIIKITDKFDRSSFFTILPRDMKMPNDYKCKMQDYKSYHFMGETANIICRSYFDYSSFAEKEFYFVDFSDENKLKLLGTSSEKEAIFPLTFLILQDAKDIRSFYIHQKFINITGYSHDAYVGNTIYKLLEFDFKYLEITETKIKINVQPHERIEGNYETFYSIGPDANTEGTEFISLGSKSSYTYSDFEINHQLAKGKYLFTLMIKYDNNQRIAKKSKVLDYERTLLPAEYGRQKFKNSAYFIQKDSAVILNPVTNDSTLQAYAEVGDKRYTLLKDKVIGMEFIEEGKLVIISKEEVIGYVFGFFRVKADDKIFMFGNGSITAGTAEDCMYKLEPPKSVAVLMYSFDGQCLRSIDNGGYAPDYDTYDEEGFWSSPGYTYQVNFIKRDNPYKYTFKNYRSDDPGFIIINSKIGTHKLATVPDDTTSNPGKDPDSNPGKDPGANPGTDTNTSSTAPMKEDTKDGEDSKQGNGNTGKIAGGVVGALVVIAVIAVIAFLIIRKKKNQADMDSHDDSIKEDKSMDESPVV
ncbi:hypothetical protein TVAG_000550 [Trichomonas vaginalis G3]|uniref:Uncharacterized protein n=1 Tax=Trichomonas vaginalis (strain ATCC PRA-98 / G3) TaxID=412133 RepID=A2EHT1_TRIV3|nr:glycoprotein 38 family [Trichomonas vaginalis G3]EAY07771.1 hypothetical protein TVAG_000550 [Trichomonas vaginalis G3]KAI5542954.1 glycoprotein 38 family [Trichomonas vaginalis G3]|eukprot:XP_001319994.1 hypothetical protein [Trichomonas vaginalis G3]